MTPTFGSCLAGQSLSRNKTVPHISGIYTRTTISKLNLLVLRRQYCGKYCLDTLELEGAKTTSYENILLKTLPCIACIQIPGSSCIPYPYTYMIFSIMIKSGPKFNAYLMQLQRNCTHDSSICIISTSVWSLK